MAVAVVVLTVVLAGCRVDVSVDVDMAQDGSGTLTVTLAADSEVVAQAPGLADDLRFDDLEAVGWTITGPTPTSDLGLQVSLVHEFAAPEELTALIASLNGTDGPFKTVLFRRVDTGEEITFSISGAGRVDAGLASFADADLIDAVGATPYADDVASAGLSQTDAVHLDLRVDLPGSVERTTGTEVDGALSWTIPLDSTPVELTTTSSVNLERHGPWSVLSTVFHVLLMAWIVIAVLVLAYVPIARRRRARRWAPLRRALRPSTHPAMRQPARPGAPPTAQNEWDDWDDELGLGGDDPGGDHRSEWTFPDSGEDPGPDRPIFPRPNR